ncbi:MOSC domain-containing protein [Novosphingobium sp. PS1R-30]|uniref:MOSC domain-containing protein n=1 Tax=Novosphingobium anseongense TaxID=3133436 RepID=A0ABU8RTE0_9SPHN
MTAGRLGGIARHARSQGPIETIGHVSVTAAEGVHGDFRGAMAATKKTRKRQVSLIEAESWAAALADLGLAPGEGPPWSDRRANLLVEGLRLPREPGKIIAIGATLRIETTVETEPCERMDALLPGLKATLMPDWRGGVCGRVVTDGDIAIGDEVRIEE